MEKGLTSKLGEFVSQLRYQDIPSDALVAVRRAFTDCVGVMIAGAHEPAPQILKSTLAPAHGNATLYFGPERVPALDAALINATAAHALDFDDVAAPAVRGHPSPILVPPILAEGEALGATGQQLVLAYAAGFEAWAEVARRDPDQHQGKGLHPTSVLGVIGAAAACAALRRLDAATTARAIAIAASQSAGLTANFGTMTKPLHAGKAAHAGLLSVRLAENGFTAAEDALEHPPGFLAAISPAGRFDISSPLEAGIEWKLVRHGIGFKKYPLCFAVHRVLDALFDMMKLHSLTAETITRVTTKIRRRRANVLRYHMPQTALEGKFSMEFAVASAMIAGRASLTELNDAFVRRPDVQAFMTRVVLIPDDRETDPALAHLEDEVSVETVDGRRLDSGPITKTRGGPEAPLQPEEMWAKFESCLQAGAATVPARKLFDALMSLDSVGHVSEIPGLGRR